MEEKVQGCTADWLPVAKEHIDQYKDIAIIATEKGNPNPLWAIHARYDGDLIPGQLDVNKYEASVPYGGKARIVTDFEVACRIPETVLWVNGYGGVVPTNAIVGGREKCSKELLYVGRGEHEGQMYPGKVQASHKGLYICYNGDEVKLDYYQVLCLRGGCS